MRNDLAVRPVAARGLGGMTAVILKRSEWWTTTPTSATYLIEIKYDIISKYRTLKNKVNLLISYIC